MITLGSLFSGIGGFEYAGQLVGITPIWASEIEPAPISITQRHFPAVKHLGDINKILGSTIEPVDIITFGSPCQDLSIAGNRAGLDGDKSSLFREAIRIIKEMRAETNGEYPRIIVWENVPGAFSSNQKEDFRRVLQEIADIAQAGVSIPKSKKWPTAGGVMGDGWSLAWRVLDAQYWGVPQRRRRIFLVADFGGKCAGEILFKRQSLSGNFASSGAAWQGNTTSIVDGVTAAGFNGWRSTSGMIEYAADQAPCIQSTMPPNVVCYDARGNGGGQISNTLAGDHQSRITDYTALAVYQSQGGEIRSRNVANTLTTNGNASGRNAPIIAVDCRNIATQQASGTLQAKSSGGYSLNYINPVVVPFGNKSFGEYVPTDGDLIVANYTIRRLTPLECERLQGYPDNWTAYGHDDKPISDTQRYKALGNSVAIPCVVYVLQGCLETVNHDNTNIREGKPMQIIKPSVQILDELDGQAILRKLERIGRVCYKSEDKITEDSAAPFIERIIRSGHESVIEHVSISVRFVCDRGVSHEIVRHRIASYSQESTRYCNHIDGLTFIIPSWLDLPEGRVKNLAGDWLFSDPGYVVNADADLWLTAMWDTTQAHATAIRVWLPQEARSVLPNSLKTELIMTANLREWRHFLRLRTAPAAHPQMRELACQLLDQMRSTIPVIFDDI